MEELYEIDDTMLEAAVNASKIAKLEAEYVKNRSAAALQQLTKLSKMGKYNMKSLRKKMKQVSESEQIELDEKRKKRRKRKKKKKSGGKKDACYHKVKARYDVWPSAYASGALVKCRKVGAANWGNKSKKKESIEFDDHVLQIIREEYAAVIKLHKKKTNENEEIELDEESLRQWFKGGGWRQAGGKYDGKPCARQPGQKTTPKCVSRKKYSSMSKKERESAGRRKRRKDPNQTKKTGAAKPTYVKTDPQKKGKKKKK